MRRAGLMLMLVTMLASGGTSTMALEPTPGTVGETVEAMTRSSITLDDAVALVLASDPRFTDLADWEVLWKRGLAELKPLVLEDSYYRVLSSQILGMTPLSFWWVSPRVAPSWVIEVTLVRDCDAWLMPDEIAITADTEPFLDDPCGWRHSWVYRVRPDGEVMLLFHEGDPDP